MKEVLLRFLFVILIVTIPFTTHAQVDVDSESKEKYFPLHFLNAGLGTSHYGLTRMASFHFNPYSRFTVGIDYTISEEFAPLEKSKSSTIIAYMVGYMENPYDPAIILLAGPAQVNFREVVSPGENASPSDTEYRYINTWGLSLKTQLHLSRGGVATFTISPYLNFNRHKTFGGATFNITFGYLGDKD